MRLSVRIVSCVVTMLSAASATSAVAQPDRQSDRQAALGEKLDALVDDAVSGGLLQQRRTEQPARGGSEPDKQSSADVNKTEIDAIEPVTLCDAPYLFDYSDYDHLTTYSDLPKGAVGEGDRTVSGNIPNRDYNDDTRLVKSYLALGLFSEADTLIRDLPLESRASFTRFAGLFDAANSPDIPYFEALGECRDRAKLWLALALKNQDPERAAALLETNIQTYRHLPFRLRLLIATKTVPALIAAEEKLLAEKLLRGFAPEEIEFSPRLKFIQALLRLGKGNETPELIVRNDLYPQDLRNDVITVLLRTYRPENGNTFDVRLNDVLDYLDHTEDVESKAAAFLYVLNELAGMRDYDGIKDLARRPSLDAPEAQAQIKQAIETSLLSDLNSGSSPRQFDAMEVLINDSKYFSSDALSKDLYVQASQIARQSGNTRLASVLISKIRSGEIADQAAAEHIFRTENSIDLYDMASQYPGNQSINRIAGITALNNGDIDALRNIENRLLNDPVAILDLLEIDILSEEQNVSEVLYQAVAAITDPELISRANRIFASRSRNREYVFSVNDPKALLARTSEFLDARNGGVE